VKGDSFSKRWGGGREVGQEIKARNVCKKGDQGRELENTNRVKGDSLAGGRKGRGGGRTNEKSGRTHTH